MKTPWIAIQELVLPANFEVPAHGHTPPHVLVMVAGSMNEVDGGASQVCSHGSVRYSPGNDNHVVRIGAEGAHCLIIEAPGFPELQLTNREYVSSADAERQVSALRKVLFEAECVSPGAVEEAALALFTLVRTRRHSEQVRHHEWITRVRDAFADLKPTKSPLADAARAVGRNASLVSRTFRATYAVSVLHYYRRRQIDHAWLLLATTSEPISMIALECGFSDQSHLTKAFSEASGITPAQLRKRIAERTEFAAHWYRAVPMSPAHL